MHINDLMVEIYLQCLTKVGFSRCGISLWTYSTADELVMTKTSIAMLFIVFKVQ